MMYVEFIERDRFVPIEVFRHFADQGSSWVEGAVDRMVLQLGRTLRLGPSPTYLAFWKIPHVGRLDEWEAYFRSDAWPRNRRSTAMHRSIHIQAAGLYDELHEAAPVPEALYYVEYFDAEPDHGHDAVAAWFASRQRAHAGSGLCHVLRRIGLLGPDPANLAVWAFPGYESVEAFARGQTRTEGIRVSGVGVYRTLGAEVL